MAMESAKQFLDQRIAALTAELEQAKGLRNALDNESLFKQLKSLMQMDNGSHKPSQEKLPPSQAQGGNNRERVMAFFAANGNEWVTAAEIVAKTGVDRGVLSNLVYVGNADDFESKDHPTKKRRKLWRVKPEVLRK